MKVLKFTFFALFLALMVSSLCRTAKFNIDFRVFHGAAEKFVRGTHDFYEKGPSYSGAPFKYTPFFPVVFAPFGYLPEPLARTFWAVLNMCFFVLAWWLSERLLYYYLGVNSIGWGTRLLTLIMFLDVVTVNATHGALNLCLLCLILGSLVLERRSAFLGGFLAGVGTAMKLTPAAVAVYFLVSRRYRAFFWTAFFSVLFLIIVPVILWGPEETLGFYRDWSGVLKDRNHFPFLKYSNQSGIAVGERIFGEVWWGYALHIVLNFFVFGSMLIFCRRRDFQKIVLLLCLALPMTLPSLVWMEYYVMSLPIVFYMNHLLCQGKLDTIGVGLWAVRLVWVNVFVLSLVGRTMAYAVSSWGQHLFGLILALIICYRSEAAEARSLDINR